MNFDYVYRLAKYPNYVYLLAVILFVTVAVFLVKIDVSVYFPVNISRRLMSLKWLLGVLGGLLVISTAYYKWSHPQSENAGLIVFIGSIVSLFGLLLQEPPKATVSDVDILTNAIKNVMSVDSLSGADPTSARIAETLYRSSTDPFELGIALFRFGNIESSLQHFYAASTRTHYSKDKQANIDYYIGNCLYLLERYEEALSAFEASVSKRGIFSDAYNNMGLTLMLLNRPSDALVAYNNSIRSDPRNEKAWLNKSSTLSELGRMEEAEESFNAASDIQENIDLAWNDGVVLKICIDRLLDQLPRTLTSDRGMVQGRSRAISLIGNLWPNGATVPVRFIGADRALQERIIDIASGWSEHANLNFERTTDSEAPIRISFVPGPSWSFLGTDASKVPKDQATLNLGWVTNDTPDHVLTSVVLHQFGHVLGLPHEYQVPFDGIKWNVPEIRRHYSGPPNFWDNQQIEKMFLEKYEVSQIMGVEFDPSSMMRLPIPNELTLDGYSVAWNNELSEQDKILVSSESLYPK